MKKKILVFFITIFFLFISPIQSIAEINNSVIITVGKYPITRLDLFKEIKLITILSGGQITNENKKQIQDLAINSLIKKAIKTIEIEKRQVEKYSKKDLENLILSASKNLGTDKTGLKGLLERNNLNYDELVNKFKVDLKWNSMIFDIYKNKISLNTVEIENKLNLAVKNIKEGENREKRIEEIKQNIVFQEKNKKLQMFSNSHYSNLERVIQIKFL